jgi:hypothetical protein
MDVISTAPVALQRTLSCKTVCTTLAEKHVQLAVVLGHPCFLATLYAGYPK